MKLLAKGPVTDSKLPTGELRRHLEEYAQLLVKWKSLTDALAEAGRGFTGSRNEMEQRRVGSEDWYSN
jgi:hypothetical protein